MELSVRNRFMVLGYSAVDRAQSRHAGDQVSNPEPTLSTILQTAQNVCLGRRTTKNVN